MAGYSSQVTKHTHLRVQYVKYLGLGVQGISSSQAILKTLNLTFRCLPRGYKTFFMLNSIEHEIFPAHK